MNDTPRLDLLLEAASAAARAAGRHALENRHRRAEIVQRSVHDVKLALDLECQRRAEEAIARAWPEPRILGEEGASGPANRAPVWIIDPLDGTVNFLHGMPLWCSSVAVAQDGEVLAGAVFVPELNELYTATREGPAQRNGVAIRVSETPTVAEAMVLTGLSKHMESNPAALGFLAAIADRAQKTRVMGAAAVDICHVACGRADGYYESSIYLWDVAAAGLIARRAGGRTEILRQFSPVHLQYLCTNGRIHAELKSLVQQDPRRAEIKS
ncbi:MAG: inositol monophosphatase [Verrucomicrobia bacterium]|nr:inositol monophosphatase [Verrucomicrobiota bacterium]MBU1910325.1 inositol monophosphatase [Verrucomicrobiota bacterium]